MNLCIVSLLKQGLTAGAVCHKLNLKKTALSYYLSTLKQQGIVQYVSYGVWEVIKDFQIKDVQKSSRATSSKMKGVEVLDVVTEQKEKETRGHGFIIKFKIRDRITNWNNRGEVLNKHFKYLQPKPLNKGTGWGITFNDHKIHLWRKSIVIYSEYSFVSKLASNSKSTAIDHFVTLIRQMERMFHCEGQFKFRGRYTFNFSREHYGLMRNVLARQYNRKGEKLRVSNEYGVWCVIDDSLSLDELEFQKNRSPDPDDAVKNSEGMQRFINELRELEWEFQPKSVMQIVGGTAQNVDMFGRHMVSHVEAIQKISRRIDKMDARDEELTGVLESIKKELRFHRKTRGGKGF